MKIMKILTFENHSFIKEKYAMEINLLIKRKKAYIYSRNFQNIKFYL